jgi:hypothetical protein
MSDVWSIDGTRNYHEGVDNFGNAHLDGNVDLSDVDDEQYECWQSRQARERERVGWGESTEQAAGVEYWREDEEMRQQEHYRPQRSNAHWESQQHVLAHILSHSSESERDSGANMSWESNDDSDDGESGARVRAQLSPHRLRFARSLREREPHVQWNPDPDQVADYLSEMWKDFPDTMDRLRALNLLGETRRMVQHAYHTLYKIQRSRHWSQWMRAVDYHTNLQVGLLNLNQKFVQICRSNTPASSHERHFNAEKCGLVDWLTRSAQQE